MGKTPASANYIGLIAYLVKANTELHEMVKSIRRLANRLRNVANPEKNKILQSNYLFFEYLDT